MHKEEKQMLDNYNYQKEANITCLIEDKGYVERKNVMLQRVRKFSEANIGWGMGCSTNLFLRGIVDEFHDFDLIVDAKDIPAIQKIIEELGGELIATGGNGFCESDNYFHYQLGRVDVDVISGFRVKTFGTEYLYKYDLKEIETCIIYEEDIVKIPLIPMEALYLLYCMMEGWQSKRRYKRVLIQEYLRNNIKYKTILEEALNQELPSWVKRNVRELLEA